MSASDPGAAVVVTRLFTEALDARDLDALRVLVADNLEFRNREGGTLTGWDGMKAVVAAAQDADMIMVREGPEEIDSSDGVEGSRSRCARSSSATSCTAPLCSRSATRPSRPSKC